jgi:phospholipid-binding lipoprotein MlaA
MPHQQPSPKPQQPQTMRRPLFLLLAASLYACSETPPKNEQDPLEDMNRGVQDFNDGMDDYVMKPVAEGYRWVMPTVVDAGVTNFFNNLDDIGVFVNDFLQFKWEQGGMDMGRFMVNTVAGVGGFLDVASELDLPKHKEDFDQTLGSWGMPTGPYLVLPVLGPGTPRSLLGMAGDSATNPINFFFPMVVPLATGALNATDKRADLLGLSKIADQAAMDRYEFIRNAYLQERNYQVHDGNPPLDADIEKELDEQMEAESKQEAAAGTPPPSRATVRRNTSGP